MGTTLLFCVLFWKKIWELLLTELPLYGYLPPISQTLQVIRSKHSGQFWWSEGKLMSNVLWINQCWIISKNLHTSALGETGCYLEDLPRAIDDSDGERERELKESLLSICLDDDDDDDDDIILLWFWEILTKETSWILKIHVASHLFIKQSNIQGSA